MTTIGVDIGGTGIKAAAVDTRAGRRASDRVRCDTPHPADRNHTVAAVRKLIHSVETNTGEIGSIGVGFPGVVQGGVVRTAAHLDKSWVGVNADDLFSEALERPTRVVNDADAAGLAEVRFGAGIDQHASILMLTLGTGIGSGLFLNGQLMPNTELGHLIIGGHEAETRAAASIHHDKHLSWEVWGRRLDAYLLEIERLLWPDLIIIGGGISDEFEHFGKYLTGHTTVVPATLSNDAGIIGAAVWAEDARLGQASSGT